MKETNEKKSTIQLYESKISIKNDIFVPDEMEK